MSGPSNRNEALARALVDELARAGVSLAVISPGSRSTPTTLALDTHPEISTAVVLDERSAGFFALASALASGRPTVVTCTSGSAAANLHPAVVEADEAGVPLVVLTNDRPPELRGIGAGQTIDQIGLYGSAVRWFCEAGTHEADDDGLLHLRALGSRAVAEATLGRGPVQLNLSWRDPLGPEPVPGDLTATSPLALSGRADRRPLTAARRERGPSSELVEELADRVGRAERPLILAGRQPDPELAAPVARLAAAAGAPLLAEPTSQLRSGEHDRSRLVCAYDLIVRSAGGALEPDLVLRFGDMPTSKALRVWLRSLEPVEQVVIDPPGHWNEPTRTASLLLRVDPLELATAVTPRLEPGETPFLDAWLEAERRAQRAIDEALSAESDPNEPALHRLLPSCLAPGDRLLLASSMPVRDHEAFSRGVDSPLACFANRGANGIDGLVSTAAGIARGGEAPTWAVLGDLAVAHDLGGFATLSEAGQPVRIVAINNGGGAIFDFLPQAEQVDRERFERLFTTPSRLELERVARLFGLAYERIEELRQLNELHAHDRVLAEVPTDRGANLDLHRRLAAAVQAALS